MDAAGNSGIMQERSIASLRNIVFIGTSLYLVMDQIQQMFRLSQRFRMISNMLPEAIQLIVYVIIFSIAVSVNMGKRWSVCGINNCARKHGHNGPHSGEIVAALGGADQIDSVLSGIQMTGEIGAIKRQMKDDPERMALVHDAYLKNRPGHKHAVVALARLDLVRAAEKLGIDL